MHPQRQLSKGFNLITQPNKKVRSLKLNQARDEKFHSKLYFSNLLYNVFLSMFNNFAAFDLL